MCVKGSARCHLIAAATALITCLAPGVASAQNDAGDKTLKEQLDATNAEFSSRIPEEMLNSINNAVDEVTKTGILDQVIKEGDRAPDFDLPDSLGNRVKLSSLLAEGPVVLTWYRGNW